MLKKARLLTRPTPARQDAPFRGQGRSSATDARFTFHGSWERSENEAGGLFQHPARLTARFVTLLAIQSLSEMLSPAFLCQDPGPIRHRRLVAHVLTMATS